MEANESKKEQNVEEMNAIKQFMELMGQQGMKEQSQDFVEVLRYIAGMQLQLGAMVNELQGVREQLEKLQENQPKEVSSKLINRVSHLQEKINRLSKRLSALKDHLIDTAVQAVTTFREKGRQEMNRVLQKGISTAKSVLSDCREKMVDVLTNYEKTANQIDSIGDELKQMGNSFANVGRLISGKGTKEVSDEKPGVGLTRVINMPVKKHISTIRKQIDQIDRAVDKLDKFSGGLEPEEKTEKKPEKEEKSQGKSEKGQNHEKNPKKETKKNIEKVTEKKERVSIKEKLSEMKSKSEQQKKEPEAVKTKSKAECL